jgi:hypothetical protein
MTPILTPEMMEAFVNWLKAGVVIVTALSAFVYPFIQMMKPWWSGLTKPIGNGKLTVANYLDMTAAIVLSFAFAFLFNINGFPGSSTLPIVIPDWAGIVMTATFASVGSIS